MVHAKIGCQRSALPVSRRVQVHRRSAAVLKAASTSSPPVEAPSDASTVYDAVIVGAGISGLVTALALDTKHSGNVQSVLVTEARERVGGNITSCSNGEYLWEEGPNSFQPSDSVLEAAVRELMSLLKIVTPASVT